MIKKALTTLIIFGGIATPSLGLAEQIVPAQQTELVQFSQAELEQVLAPIALYPDTLLTHILIAATYPIEVIDADRFIKKNDNFSNQALVEKAANKNWDPSVKALLSFPRILDNLSKDLSWMRKLGDAFLQDESQVLASIQILRQKADEAGSLSQMDNVEIVREKRTIIIEPVEPEVIYVPYYDTRVVYGNWHWSHYPPVYWHRPSHYAYYHGPFYWQSSVHIGFDFFFSAFHWSNHHVVRHHHKKRYHHSNRRIATSHHAKRWSHNPEHRRGVAYRSKKVSHRYGSVKPSIEHDRITRKQYSRSANSKNEQLSRHKKNVRPAHNSAKHRQVSQRLQVNKAVRIDTKEFKKQRNKHKYNVPEQSRSTVKRYANTKVRKHNEFQVAPERSQDKRIFKKQSYKGERTLISDDARVFKPNQGRKQSRIEPVKPEQTFSQKQHRVSQVKQKSHKAKGSHSSKNYARVTKNNSSRTKSHSSKSRIKHK